MSHRGKKPIVFMFSGQGSQYYHMAGELFTKNIVFKKQMQILDIQVKDIIGESVLARLYDTKKRKIDAFDRLLYTHPALFMLQYSLAKVFQKKGINPDYVLGASLGEFVSAAIAGMISVEDALTAVIRQAQDLEAYCPKGGMLAILNKPALYEKEPVIRENSELAGINFSKHFIVSGTPDGLKRVSDFLQKKSIHYLLLPISRGAHSSLIEPAKAHYSDFLNTLSVNPPEIPFISCARACRADDIQAAYFWEIAEKPILFMETIQEMETSGSHTYIDVGPSGTLANFVPFNLQNNSASKALTTITPFSRDESGIEKVIFFFSNSAPLVKTSNEKSPDKFLSGVHGKKNSMQAFMFPGQGSQKKGMGNSLFDDFREFTEKADAILGYSIQELCTDNSGGRLNNTEYTQPALYVVNALTWLKHMQDNERMPDFLVGHSLGEYNALFAAGTFDFETGLKLTIERGRLMAQAKGGGMAAVIGFDQKRIADILEQNHLADICIANWNTDDQFVISGPKTEIEKAESIFRSAGVRVYIQLKVSGAFHSFHMKEAADAFTRFLATFTFNKPAIPVIANTTALPYPKDGIKSLLSAQMTSPVLWTDSVRYLMGQGVKEFKEIGPGKILTGLIRKIEKQVVPLNLKPELRNLNPESNKFELSKPESNKPESCRVGKSEALPTVHGGHKKNMPVLQRDKTFVQAHTASITAVSLGSEAFKQEYNLKYAYLTGGMFRGIASADLVIAMGKAGMMGYLGTGGMAPDDVEDAILKIKKHLGEKSFGMNFLHNYNKPEEEEIFTDLYLKYGIKNVEAAAYISITPALVRYRVAGLYRGKNGVVSAGNKIMAKISRPEVAETFLRPAPEKIVRRLLEKEMIQKEQAEMAKEIPMADAICAEADSGGHTDGASAYSLLPSIIRQRDRIYRQYGYAKHVHVGTAGGIGTPEAAAAAFVLGADFILTGSINQCTVESGTSDMVKDMLQEMNIQDTDYVPAGDMFETDSKVQVLRKGVFFPARAKRLHELYRNHNSIDDIDEKTKRQIQDKYFKRSFDEIWEETKEFFTTRDLNQIKRAEKNPKHKMALIFKWYFNYSTRMGIDGKSEERVNFQIHTGPALGAFNQWVKGTEFENWRQRRVDKIAVKLMQETAELLNQQFERLTANSPGKRKEA